MFISIITRYRGATEHRGSRFLATSTGARSSHPYDYSLNPEGNHAAAADAHAAFEFPAGVAHARAYLPDGISRVHIYKLG